MNPHTPARRLSMERDQIDVTSALADSNGHEHRQVNGTYPTLRWVVEETGWCEDCREDHGTGHYECAVCGETVRPGMVGPGSAREFVPGAARYYLDGEQISEERYRELLAEQDRP